MAATGKSPRRNLGRRNDDSQKHAVERHTQGSHNLRSRKLKYNLVFSSLNRTLKLRFEGTHAREIPNIIWFSPHLIVPL